METPGSPGGDADGPWRAFFGPNADYYLTEKRVMETSGSRVSWNWPAFLFGTLWTAYRKMWALTALLVVVHVAFTGSLVFSWMSLVLMLLMGVYGNTLYLGHARRKMAERPPDGGAAGGTSALAPVAVFILAVFLTLTVVAVWGGVLTAMLSGFALWEMLQGWTR